MGNGSLLGRDAEMHVVGSLLERGCDGPTALVIDGEAGIGKTTLCRAAGEAAVEAGFAVLTTTGAVAEVSLAWAGLADLVSGIDEQDLAALSPLHHQTLQAIKTGENANGVDERLVGTAFRAALQEVIRRHPVLIVIDDAQWLDETSRRAIGFAFRRLTGPAAVLVVYRNGESGRQDRSWLQPCDPAALIQLTVGPMTLGDLSSLVAARSGLTQPRSTMQRIHRISGGNPFYALELARALGARDGTEIESLPTSLAGLVGDRIGDVDPATLEVLATVAAAFEPSVEVIAAATERQPTEVVELLEPLESRGVVVFDGPHVRFSHPLIASGITTRAGQGVRRRAHRRLADVVTHPEQRARHLALSSPHGCAETLAALDTGAECASARGAFSTAAELVDLAIGLGGDDQMRRLRSAEYHFRAGALDEAEAVLTPILDDLPRGFLRAAGLLLLAAVRGYRDGVVSTIGLFRSAVVEAQDIPPLRTQALLLLSLACGIGGDMAGCVADARRARADADAIGLPELRSQALALWSHVSFMYGLGTDHEALRAARELEDPRIEVPVTLRPSAVYALNCAWTGRLDEAYTTMSEVRRRCADLGTEVDVLWATEQLTWIDVAAGRYDQAELRAAEAMRVAEQVGGQLPLITAHSAMALVAAYRGRLDDTRVAAEFATHRASGVGLGYLARPPLMSLAFALVSDGQYDEALTTLGALLRKFDPAHDTEIMAGAWIPDAVEALTAVGRTDEAEPLVAALETNGARHDRPWMLAVGARCRALVSAARGDLDNALAAATRAVEYHDRLPMPFERARSQLLAGQLQRRRRRTHPARANLGEAAAVFERLGSPLWIARAERELARLTSGPNRSALTDSERQIAQRAAAGESNKEIASRLFMSVKTVEMHLSRVYRKLEIRSRAQLAEQLRARAAD